MAVLIWRGDAQGQAQVEHWTPTNVKPGDTYTLTINRKDLAYVADEDLTAQADLIADVVNGLVALVNATDIPEWDDLTASVGVDSTGATTHVVLTGKSDGTPFTAAETISVASAFDVTVATTVSGTAGRNEQQKITIPPDTSGGTFTITFDGQTTGNIAYNASAATVETALEALSNISAGDVDVTGSGPWTIEFKSTYAKVNVPLMTGNGASLTGAATVDVVTTTEGSTLTNEVQLIQLDEEKELSNNPGFTELIFDTGTSAGFVTVLIGHTYTEANIQQAINNGVASVGWVVTVSDTTYHDNGNVKQFSIEFQAGAAGTDVPLVDVEVETAGGTANASETTKGSGASTDEVQKVSLLYGPTGGTFTLTFSGQTTGTIAYDASAATVKTALEALSNVNTVTVTGDDGGPWTVTFTNPGDQDVSQMTGNAGSLTGGSVTVQTTVTSLSSANEQQTVTVDDTATGGTFTLTWNPGGGNETTGNIAYDATASAVQTALEGLATPTAGDFDVIGNDGGPWTVEFKGTYADTDVNAMTGDGTNLTGVSSGTLTLSTDTSPTGPNWFSEAENWQTVGSSTATAPANGDTLHYRDSDVDCLHGLDANSGDTFAAVHVEASYTGRIGLDTHNGEYFEYRLTSLTAGITLLVVGEGEGTGSPRLRFDLEAVQSEVVVTQTGDSEDDLPAMILKGSHASNVVRVYRGSVGIAVEQAGDTATVATLQIGYVDDPDTDAAVVVGDGVTLTTVDMSGGEVEVNSAGTTWLQTGGTASIREGAWTNITVIGATLFCEVDDIWATVNIGPEGILDCSRSMEGRTFTNTTLQSGATLIDPFRTITFTNEYQLDHCGYEDVTLRLGKNISASRTNL